MDIALYKRFYSYHYYWKFRTPLLFICDEMNARNSCIWTADWNNFGVNDPRSYERYLSSSERLAWTCVCMHELCKDKSNILLRISRGLYWENKSFKLKRSIDYLTLLLWNTPSPFYTKQWFSCFNNVRAKKTIYTYIDRKSMLKIFLLWETLNSKYYFFRREGWLHFQRWQ